MSKKLLYGLLFTFMAFCGCTGDYDDWAAPQGFDVEEAVGVSISTIGVASIDMANVETDSIVLFTPTVTAPADATVVSYKVVLDGKKELASDLKGNVATVDLIGAVTDLYGKRPVERTLSAVAYAQIDKAGTGLYAKSNDFEIKVTLVAPIISSAYYLVGDMLDTKDADGNVISGWSVAGMQKFNHSGTDVYEDPVFTIIFTTTSDNQFWKIIPQENVDAIDGFWGDPGVVGTVVNGDVNLEGKLTNTGANAGKIAKAGMYKLTLNMMDYTFSIKELAFGEYIYLPGNHQAITETWKPENAPALQSSNFDGEYTGFCYLNGNFKFTKARNWDDGEYNWNDFSTFSDGFINDDGSNINMTVPGFYKIEASISAAKLTATAVTWGIVGSATSVGWDQKIALDMIWNATDESWSVTTELTAGELKFVANKDWAINLGGIKENLSQGGDNLAISEAGTYNIKLYTTRCVSDKIYCTIEKAK